MTEAEWLACGDSRMMFRHFGGVFGKMRLDPRLRRFAVESARRVRHLLTDEVFRRVADAGEAFADDPRYERRTGPTMPRAAIDGRLHICSYHGGAARHQFHAARAAIATCGPTAWQAAYNAMREAAQALNRSNARTCDPGELKYQSDMLRCIFGPRLFRPIIFAPSLLTQAVQHLAEGIYIDRDFDRLPILADALEDAGCTNRDILDHCRQPGEHARGCWVVDLVLGKS